MNELQEHEHIDEVFYHDVKNLPTQARRRIYKNIQNEMILTYWEMGKMIVEKQGGVEHSEYGDGLIKELSIQLTKDLGRGFDETNLKNIRQFYISFQNRDEVYTELSWRHYLLLIQIDNKNIRNLYVKKAIDGKWGVKRLAEEICTNTWRIQDG